MAAALAEFTDDEILAAIHAVKGATPGTERSVKEIELKALLAASEGYGDDVPVDENFHARRLPDAVWRRSERSAGIESVIQLHRLREVLALAGFTRFETVTPDIHGEYDESDVERAALALEPGSFPPVENRGEGLFLRLSGDAVDAWRRPAVRERLDALGPGHDQWALKRKHARPFREAPTSCCTRLERLLRQTGAPAGLLSNGRTLRLVSAPRGESSGWLDLHVADMVTAAGRPIVAALRLLLGETRLLALPRDTRFAALLADSRCFQNEVSERLAEQVLHALYELLRSLQAADDASDRELLREALAEHPDDVYHALLTVILRLVFLLYAEERDLLPEGETFARHYSLAGLYERLREDAALHPDTMNQRYGA